MYWRFGVAVSVCFGLANSRNCSGYHGQGAEALHPRTPRRLATDRTDCAPGYVQTQLARAMFVTAGGQAPAGLPTETARATFFGHRTPGGGRSGSRRCFHHETIDSIPPARSSTPKPRLPPAGVFFVANRDSGAIRQGCAFDTGRCRHMRRRNPQLHDRQMSARSPKTPPPMVLHPPGEAKASKELCSCP